MTGKPGWWDVLIGPGKIIDTNRFFVICSNVIGGCLGSTGPASTNPATGKPYGLDLPVITIRDMVRAQAMLIDHFGIDRLFCVLGGSMGGMQVLEWAASHSERVFSALPIATGARHSSQNIAFHEVGRQAVMADPDWNGGKYYEHGRRPEKGLAVARMAAHITYLSEAALHRKFGRNLQDRERADLRLRRRLPDRELSAPSGHDFRRPLRRQFLPLHDAARWIISTLPPTMAAGWPTPSQGTKTRFCLVSFTSDWLFPTAESRAIVHALNAAGASVSFVEIETDRGHDAFLLDEPELFAAIDGFLAPRRGHAGWRAR